MLKENLVFLNILKEFNYLSIIYLSSIYLFIYQSIYLSIYIKIRFLI